MKKINKILAYTSYAFSALFLLAIVVYVIIRQFGHSFAYFELSSNIFFVLQGVVIITVLAALSRLSFILGKSFMVEAIRNGDKINAIFFGKFYICAYGREASRRKLEKF